MIPMNALWLMLAALAVLADRVPLLLGVPGREGARLSTRGRLPPTRWRTKELRRDEQVRPLGHHFAAIAGAGP